MKMSKPQRDKGECIWFDMIAALHHVSERVDRIERRSGVLVRTVKYTAEWLHGTRALDSYCKHQC